MKLIIVESPTKAKTISSFLKGGFKVISSYGHVRDLPKSKLGVDIEKDFSLQYVIPAKARGKVSELKKIAKKAQEIILATDEDREGEAIAWHIAQILGEVKDKKINIKNFERIVFHEITPEAIQEALSHPRDIDIRLVDAQQARRALDRLVGYKLSPFLWKKVAKRLSAGRVQSVALRLIVEREREIEAFVPVEYWIIDVSLSTSSQKHFQATLEFIEGAPLEIGDIPNTSSAQKIAKDLEGASYTIANINKKESRKNPFPPFITSSLQQEAFKRLRFSSKQTMRVAQGLYERGLITYMRTDSFNLSSQSTVAAHSWIQKNLGESYALAQPRYFKKKSKGAQEAHEAIRPTNPLATPTSVSPASAPSLESAQEEKLYDLIWRRFIACQMAQAIVATTSIEVEARGEKTYGLKTTGSILVFDGFLKIWKTNMSEKELPAIEKNDELEAQEILPSQHFTQPPARYNDASLIKILEEYGIGRPSTYAPIISVIQDRNYVVKNEQRRFEPTEIGLKVNDLLVEHFPSIVDIQFTANMEEELDEIAEGKTQWKGILKKFYVPFAKILEEKYETVAKQAPEVETTDEVCEKCGKPMVVKYSRFGKFLACSGFPDCRNTKSLPGQNNGNGFDRKAFGPCPECKTGEIIRRRTKKGRWFYGCSRYPDCKHASWTKPATKENNEGGIEN